MDYAFTVPGVLFPDGTALPKGSKKMAKMAVEVVKETTDLQQAYDGSWYTIVGAGGDLNEWVEGMTNLLVEEGIGAPARWMSTTGAAVNLFAGDTDDPYPLDLAVLMFALDGLDIGKLAVFKIKAQDRWFDDIIDNMRRG